MSKRPECADCPLSDAFDGLDDALCCEKDRVVELTRLTVERTPAGYADVAAFLREEERNGGN